MKPIPAPASLHFSGETEFDDIELVGGFGSAFPVGILPAALAFGLALKAGLRLSYQPCRNGGDAATGRIRTEEAIGYVGVQLIGGIIGCLLCRNYRYLWLTGR